MEHRLYNNIGDSAIPQQALSVSGIKIFLDVFRIQILQFPQLIFGKLFPVLLLAAELLPGRFPFTKLALWN